MLWHSQAHVLQLWQSGEGNPQDLVHCRQAELISCDKEVQEHGVQRLQEGGPQHIHSTAYNAHEGLNRGLANIPIRNKSWWGLLLLTHKTNQDKLSLQKPEYWAVVMSSIVFHACNGVHLITCINATCIHVYIYKYLLVKRCLTIHSHKCMQVRSLASHHLPCCRMLKHRRRQLPTETSNVVEYEKHYDHTYTYVLRHFKLCTVLVMVCL